MQNDNSKIEEIKNKILMIEKYIDNLKNIGINSYNYRELLNKIKNNANVMYTDIYFEKEYPEIMSELDKLLLDLKKHDMNIKIFAFTDLIKTFVNFYEKNEDNFKSFRDKIFMYLKYLKNKSNDYIIDDNILNNLYNSVYKFIKQELVFLGSSETLNELKKDVIYSNRLDLAIRNELLKIDLNKSENKALRMRKNELDISDNINYLDEELIFLLIRKSLTDEEYKRYIDKMFEKTEKYYTEIHHLNFELDCAKRIYNSYKENKEKSLKLIGKNIALFTTSLGIFASSFGLAFLGASEFNKTKKYKATNIIYDESLEEKTIDGGYVKESKEKDYYIVYEPFFKNYYESCYTRIITKYDITNLDVPYQDIFDFNIESLNINGYREQENKDILTNEDLYEEPFIEIIKVIPDKEKFIIDNNYIGTFIFGIIFLAVFLHVDKRLEDLFRKIKFNDTEEFGAFGAIKEIKEHINKFNFYLGEEKERKIELDDLQNQVSEELLKNAYAINTIENITTKLTRIEDETKLNKINKNLGLIRKLEKIIK